MHNKFLQDKQGVLIVWVVVIISICICSMMWVLSAVVLGLFGDSFLTIVDDPHGIAMWNSLQYTSGFVLIILLVGALAYGLVSSFKKEDQYVMGKI